ncbi:MAG: hypothetical protein R6U86_09990 [Bacteroidales bacterium]
MKPYKLFLLLLLTAVSSGTVCSQTPRDTTATSDPVIHYVVIKNDGTRFVGEIIARDAREVLIDTPNLGQIVIPMHEIREIREARSSEVSLTGDFIPSEVFSTRYFITTNGLPVEKGESYIQWNLYGPDIQFGVRDNLGLGIMTSWFGTPLIGTVKYSIGVPGPVSLGVGMLAGTGSWAAPDFGLLLPFGAITLGDRVKNMTLSVGYGGVFYKEEDYDPVRDRTTSNRVSQGRVLISLAGMAKVGKKLSLVFDSFIVPRGGYYDHLEFIDQYDPVTGDYYFTEVTRRKRREGLALLIPGIRLQTDPDRAFQFGFAGIRFDGAFAATPIPMVQWYRKL